MTEELEMRPSEFADLDSVGFGIMYIKDREAVPSVAVATVDFATDEEATHEVQPGQPFRVAGQTWQVAEVRYPPDAEWVVVLRRVDGTA